MNNDVLVFSVQPTCWSHRRRRCQSFCRVRWYRWRLRETGISHGRDRPQPEPETTSLHAYCEKRVRWDERQRVANRQCHESVSADDTDDETDRNATDVDRGYVRSFGRYARQRCRQTTVRCAAELVAAFATRFSTRTPMSNDRRSTCPAAADAFTNADEAVTELVSITYTANPRSVVILLL